MTNEVPNPGWLIGTICYMDQEKIRLRASRSDFSDRMLDGEPRHLNGLNQYLFSYLSISTKIIFSRDFRRRGREAVFRPAFVEV